MKRGQVSIEFISVFGFVFLMMIPLIVIFYDQSGAVQDAVASNHLRNVGIKIVDKAETVYYLGQPSKTTLKVQFPTNIESFNITEHGVVIGYNNAESDLQILPLIHSNVNLTGSVSTDPGIHYIVIESLGDKVSVTG